MFLQIVFIDDRRGLGQLIAFLEQALDVLRDEVGFQIHSIVDLPKTERRQFWTCTLRQHTAGYVSQFLAQSYAWPLAGQTPPGV